MRLYVREREREISILDSEVLTVLGEIMIFNLFRSEVNDRSRGSGTSLCFGRDTVLGGELVLTLAIYAYAPNYLLFVYNMGVYLYVWPIVDRAGSLNLFVSLI